MPDHEKQPHNVKPNDVQRGAVQDIAIGVAGAAAYDALKTGAKAGIQQVKEKLGGDKSKD